MKLRMTDFEKNDVDETRCARYGRVVRARARQETRTTRRRVRDGRNARSLGIHNKHYRPLPTYTSYKRHIVSGGAQVDRYK